MLRLLADENFRGAIVRGLRRRRSDIDVVRVQDIGLSAAADQDILEWAAGEGRIVLTHDAATFVGFAYGRVRDGQPMPGVFQVGQHVPVGRAIDDILLLVEASLEGEWEGQVLYLPL